MKDQNNIKQKSRIKGEVAIIGMACVFPKAPDLQTYWQNIVSKVDAIGDPPLDRGFDQVYDPDSNANDRIYCKRGGYIEDLPLFDPAEDGVMPVAIDGAEPEHIMALKIARDALMDAGFSEKPFNRESTEVIIGRGTFVNRGYITLLQHGLVLDQTIHLLSQLHPEYTPEELENIKQKLKKSLPPFNAQTATGLSHNVMAGMIANRLDLHGPTLVVDAACASCLIALEMATRDLLTYKCDVVLIGGVQISTPPAIHMVFTQLGALSKNSHLRPFDNDADGTMLGEGIGMMVLKRKEDAERDGHRVYAVVKGVGSSSDGRALGLLAPRVEGEELALRRAYDVAGVSPSSVQLIEAHGTALPLGDITEIKALKNVFGTRDGGFPRCAIGTVKSMIGHLIPAAGIAGLIKGALSLYHKILPPTMHCDEPNPEFKMEQTPFYFNTETRPWIHGNSDTPRRAGISAFGFGGVNAHAVLEEYHHSGDADTEFYHKEWDTELCVFQGESRQELIEQCEQIYKYLEGMHKGTLLDIACSLNRTFSDMPYRLSIVSSSVRDLNKKLSYAIGRLKDPKCLRIKDRSGVYFFEEPVGRKGKLAFLFPGEGSQYVNMLRDLCLHFPEVRACFDLLDRAFADHPSKFLPSYGIFPPPLQSKDECNHAEDKLWQMNNAVDAVITADRALFRLLNRLGIQPDVILGHSSGEIMALEAAGAVDIRDEEELISHIRAGNRMIETLMSTNNIPEGILLAVGGVDFKTISKVVETYKGSLYLAMDNCLHQFVLCGSQTTIEEVASEFREKGGICQRLPFRRAYHTPLFQPVLKPLRAFFNHVNIIPPRVQLYSCMTAGPYSREPEEIRRLAVEQWARMVRFRETIEAMYNDDVRVFLEVGPRGNLTGFVNDILKGKSYLAVASNVHHRTGITQLNHALGLMAASGISMQLDALYRRRMPKRIHTFKEDGKSTNQKDQEKGQKISVSLPMLSFKPEDIKGFKKIQRKEDLSKESVMPGLEKNLFESTSEVFSSESNDDVMKEYLRTMENFLDIQHEVMQTYLSGDKSETSRISHSQTQESKTSPAFPEITDVQKPPEKSENDVSGLTAPNDSKSLINSNQDEADNETEKPSILDEEGIKSILLSLVSEKTGYPVEMIGLDQNLEADLGIDSIKRVEILSALFEQIEASDESEMEEVIQLKTLQKMLEFLSRRRLKTSFNEKLENQQEEVNIHQESIDSIKVSNLPLIGNIVHMIPHQEVKAIRKFDIEEDTFLKDHTLGGSVSKKEENLFALPVFPLFMSLEVMAEVAIQLFPDMYILGMKNIQSHDWIILEEDSITFEVYASVLNQPMKEVSVKLWIQDDKSSNAKNRLAIEGVFIFGDAYPEPPEKETFGLRTEKPLSMSPDNIYPNAMFHGPSFQSVNKATRAGDNGIEAQLEGPSTNHFFRNGSAPMFLTNPVLLDGAGQVVGLWSINYLDEKFVIFPVSIEEVWFFAPFSQPAERVLCQARTCLDEDKFIRSDINLIKSDGFFQTQIKGLIHKRINMPLKYHLFRGSREKLLSASWQEPLEQLKNNGNLMCYLLNEIPAEFLEEGNGIWRKILAYIILNSNERKVWSKLSEAEHNHTDWLLERFVGKEGVCLFLKEHYGIQVWPADVEIVANNSKVSVSKELIDHVNKSISLSIARANGVAVALVAEKTENQCMGIEIIEYPVKEKEIDRVEMSSDESRLISEFDMGDLTEWSHRISCAKNAAAKAIGVSLTGADQDLKVRKLDKESGTLEFEATESLIQKFPQITTKHIKVSTIRKNNFIVACTAR
jgi:acyl transferase domain-containing protein/phosphopantetheinyl transferase (holo-ACP synthase)